MTKYAHDYYQEYLEGFRAYSDLELIEAFNGQVGNHGWGTAKSGYISSLRHELDRRNINRDSISGKDGLSISYAKKVALYNLDGQKLIKPID